jgi:flagellar motor switch protein FliM
MSADNDELGKETDDDDALAQEWANMADEETQDQEENLERILSQDEIDNLLGGASSSGPTIAGIDFLINNSKISHERLPMLEVVFDRLVRNLSTSLRNFTSSSVDINIDEMTSYRFGDYLDSVSLPALLTVFRAEEWESLSLLYVETNLVYTLVDVLLGGTHEKAGLKVEGRPFTTIERNLVKELVTIVLHDFTQAFSTISPVTFSYDRMETTPRFAAIVRPVDATIIVNVRVMIDGRGGCIQFAIPYASLEPVREQIVQMFMGEKSGQDNIWKGHLQKEVWDAEVPVDAILGEVTLPLQDVLNWKKGSQFILRTKPHSVINASVGGFEILSGRMGRRDHYVALRIEENLVREKLKALYHNQEKRKENS